MDNEKEVDVRQLAEEAIRLAEAVESPEGELVERSSRRNQPPAAIRERIAKLERAVNEATRLLTYPYCGTNSEFSRHRDAWLKEHGS